MYIPKIPDNSLKEEITRIIELCVKNNERFGCETSSFCAKESEDAIRLMEQELGANIPESYKDWLRFSHKCNIAHNLAWFWGTADLHSMYISEDYVFIGTLIGDGEMICFSKTTGKFIEYYEGEVHEVESFKDILKRLIRMLEGAPVLSGNRCDEVLSFISNDNISARTGADEFAFIDLCTSLARNSTSQRITSAFRKLPAAARKAFIGYLTAEERRELVSHLRDQAVKDFWEEERKLLKNGECTYDWSPTQIEQIMNISAETGNCNAIAGIPLSGYTGGGRAFIARHIHRAADHPEFSGQWNNIKAEKYIYYFEHVLNFAKLRDEEYSKPAKYFREIDASNSLKPEIEKLLKLCEKYDENHGYRSSYFAGPVSEEEMQRWEQENGVHIPETVKDWLRFTQGCSIAERSAWFMGPTSFTSQYLPDDLVAIGGEIGDGEMICFSKTTGKVIDLFEGEVKEFDSLKDVLNSINDLIDESKPSISDETWDMLMKKYEEDKAKGLI